MKRTLPIEKKLNENEPSKRSERESQQLIDPSTATNKRPQKVQKSSQESNHELKAIRERLKRDVLAYKDDIVSSGIYADDNYQYRHIILPKEIAAYLPHAKDKILLKEHEYRRLGIDISSGWEHYMTYQPEPHILLLRRTHELASKLKKERDEYIAKKKREKEAAERAKAGAAQPSSDNNAPESSTISTTSAPEKTTRRRKPTTTTTVTGTTEGQQETKDNQA
ncbi:regulatory subunit of cyclin-dependent kinase [Absidia repens]|uniref:Cyclin-dependent kinases regulatory subunit n=1 Tax=Absidia repens TaxID=90262 RepID=A0A1X2J3A7_9FUNG|nr:regulatory subunit of cyclin-dependent kinase [Absidia repens]